MAWEAAPPLGFMVTDTRFRRLILAGEGNGTTGGPSGLAAGTGEGTHGPQTAMRQHKYTNTALTVFSLEIILPV